MRSGLPATLTLTVTFVSALLGVHARSMKMRCELPIQSARTFVTVSGTVAPAVAGSATSEEAAASIATDVTSMCRICSQPTLLARRRPPVRPVMSAIVQHERHGAVALVRLNRPAALNALSDDLLAALCASLDAVEEAGEARCIVLCGAGRAFAAGADVAGLRALSPDEALSGERGGGGSGCVLPACP